MAFVDLADGDGEAGASMIGEGGEPMRPYRWAVVPLPFVGLALLVGALSSRVGLPR